MHIQELKMHVLIFVNFRRKPRGVFWSIVDTVLYSVPHWNSQICTFHHLKRTWLEIQKRPAPSDVSFDTVRRYARNEPGSHAPAALERDEIIGEMNIQTSRHRQFISGAYARSLVKPHVTMRVYFIWQKRHECCNTTCYFRNFNIDFCYAAYISIVVSVKF